MPKAKDLSTTLGAINILQKKSRAKIGSTEQLSKEKELLVKAKNFNTIVKALKMADYLSPKYHVVVANPPYMGSKGMNARLATWVKEKYPKSKSDLFAMFIERNLELVRQKGSVGMITMQSWMFLSSFIF